MAPPRLHPNSTARARAHKEARVAAGGRRLGIVLRPEAAEALAAIQDELGWSATRVVEDVLLAEGRRLAARRDSGSDAPRAPDAG
jgi:hypothetical protein